MVSVDQSYLVSTCSKNVGETALWMIRFVHKTTRTMPVRASNAMACCEHAVSVTVSL